MLYPETWETPGEGQHKAPVTGLIAKKEGECGYETQDPRPDRAMTKSRGTPCLWKETLRLSPPPITLPGSLMNTYMASFYIP